MGPKAVGSGFILIKKTYLAIDFETADPGADSACAVGLARVEGGEIVKTYSTLIKPPRPRVMFTEIHGITYSMVKSKPNMGQIWEEIYPMFQDVDFMVAHNASFDSRVLKGSLSLYKIPMPEIPFVCTVQIARQAWGIFPTKLDHVCYHLGIELNHHEALSDAVGSATILTKAIRRHAMEIEETCSRCKPLQSKGMTKELRSGPKFRASIDP